MGSKASLYFGISGQYAVMSELLALGYNVARPEVDVGDDIISVSDINGAITLVQVKAANGKPFKRNIEKVNFQFSVPGSQLKLDRPHAFYYVFLLRHNSKWLCAIVLSQQELRTILDKGQLGKPNAGGYYTLRLQHRDKTVFRDSEDWSQHMDAWVKRWKKIAH